MKTITVNRDRRSHSRFDTTFTSANTDAIDSVLDFGPAQHSERNTGAGQRDALDGALNKSAIDTLSLTVGNVPPADVTSAARRAKPSRSSANQSSFRSEASSAVKVRSASASGRPALRRC